MAENITAYNKKSVGWNQEEESILFDAVQRARAEGLPLRTVFQAVADATNRRPNSIRNYYYACIRDNHGMVSCAHAAAFIPFERDEVDILLEKILTEQAKGRSVRAITLEMGNGDNKAMLRYQNKYRSLLKSDRALVEQTVNRLRQSGVSAFNPYEDKRENKAGRPKKKDARELIEVVSRTVNELTRVRGLDVSAFFDGLYKIASGAGGFSENDIDAVENAELTERISMLTERNEALNKELDDRKKRFSYLLNMFIQLMNVNREFLGMTSVAKVSSLGSYIRELSRSLEQCECEVRDLSGNA